MRWFLGFVSSILAYSAAPPAFRLPDTARPTHYELELTIVPRDATFRGIARIRAEVTKQTQSLWLNSRGLTIESVTLDAPNPRRNTRISPLPANFWRFGPAISRPAPCAWKSPGAAS